MADTHYRPSMYGARTTFNPATYARESVDVDYPPAADYADDYAGNMTVMVPKVVYDQEEESYEVPRLVIETATRLVPRTRRVMEERTRMVREPVTVLEEREEVVQVPRIEMEEVIIKVPKTVFDRYVLPCPLAADRGVPSSIKLRTLTGRLRCRRAARRGR